jgi:hypothetical protein
MRLFDFFYMAYLASREGRQFPGLLISIRYGYSDLGMVRHQFIAAGDESRT